MKKFTICIEKIDTMYIEVQATSEDEATQKIEKKYHAGEIDITDGHSSLIIESVDLNN